MSNKKIGTGGIIAIILGSVAVIGGVLWLVLKPKKDTKATGNPNKNTAPPKPNNGKNQLATTPINNNTVEKTLLDQLSKLLSGKKDASGGASKGGGVGSGGGGSKIDKQKNPNTEWKQDKEGYWKDPTDGRMYWENEDGTMTDKITGDMYDPVTGEWLGIDYGDGSYSDPDGNLYIYNEVTGEWDKGGYAYDDGSWSDADGVLYDESGNEIGYVYEDGSWSDENGILYDENDNEIGQVYNDGTWMDSDGDIWDSETGEQVYFDDSWMDDEDDNFDDSWMDEDYAIGKVKKNNANKFYKK